MKTLLLAAGAIAAALTAGQALAATHHRASASAAIAGPKQPIPYAELNAYLKASPKQRASKDWGSQAQASTGASANTAAVSTAGADPSAAASATTSAAPPLPATPPVNTPSTTDATPPPTAATPAAPVNPPPK